MPLSILLALVFAAIVPAHAGEPMSSEFAAACAAKAEAAGAGRLAVEGADGFLFLTNELRHVGAGEFWGDSAAKVSRSTSPQHADPLPAIIDFSNQLKELGIELIFVPVPPKAFVYADKVGVGVATPARLDENHQAFYKLLADNGVKVLDLTQTFIDARQSDAEFGSVYCKTDTHWSPRGCVIASEEIAKLVGGPGWRKDATKHDFKVSDRMVDIAGDLAKSLGRETDKETLNLRVVTPPQGMSIEDRTSPVLLIGDSHTLVFNAGGDMHAKDAGLAAQLAHDLCMPIDVMGTRGSGATSVRVNLYRHARRDASYLAGKKVVIWCLTAREFTETTDGWRVTPVSPK